MVTNFIFQIFALRQLLVENGAYLHFSGVVLPGLLREAVVEVFVEIGTTILMPGFRVLIEVVIVDLGQLEPISTLPLLRWHCLDHLLIIGLVSGGRGVLSSGCGLLVRL